jgi:glucose-1-phosphate cytidylyltransferase
VSGQDEKGNGMKVVILCGGQGTRIRDVSETLPKPMLPIGQFPILWHIMKYYACFGHVDFILCLGFKASVIKDFFLNYDMHTNDVTLTLGRTHNVEIHGHRMDEDWRVTLANTGLNAMTGARVRRIERYVGDDENFMLTYGDGVGNIDLDALLTFHKAHGKALTLTGVRPPGRFGELELSDKGVVQEFNEKPQATGGRINGGFFVCRREIFNYLDDEEGLVFEQSPMQALVAAGEVMVYRHDGFWQCMDTMRDHNFLNGIWEEGEAPWNIWAART